MAQFRVEFVLDEATGKYLAELYNPENQAELIARTEALYATQAAAVLGLVKLFKEATTKPVKKKAAARRRKTPTRRKKK